MNKGDFIKAVAAKAGLTQKDAEAAWNASEDVIIETLSAGDKVILMGFGTFESRTRAARSGINPLTKEKIKIPPTNSVNFKAGKPFKDAVNAKKK